MRDRAHRLSAPDEETGGLQVWLKGQLIVRLASFVRGYTLQAAGTVAAMILLTATGLAGPYLLKLAIDSGIANDDFFFVGMMAALYFVVALLGALFNGLQTYGVQWVGERIVRDLRDTLFQHLTSLDIGYYTKQRAGWVISRLTNDIEALEQLLTEGTNTLVTNVLTLVGATIILFTLDLHLAAVTLSVLPPLVIGTMVFRLYAVKAYRRVRNAVADVTVYLQESVSGIRVVKAFAHEDRNFGRFREVNEKYRKANMDTVVISGLYFPSVEFLNATATAIILLYGGYRAAEGEVTIGILVAFIGYLASFFSPVESLSELYNSFQSAGAAMEKVFTVLDTKPASTEVDGDRTVEHLQGEVEFRNVSFNYEEEGAEVLHDVSVHIPAGQKVALVGATGAGKTTFARLVLRFFAPTEGAVLIDGRDAREYDVRAYRRLVGYVPQEPFLFTGSILDNIRLARPDATEEEVRASVRALGIEDVIASLPEGYDTDVQEAGSRLSSGERQLVVFARAFFSSPAILILDEATSSVDPGTEHRLEEALHRLLANRTALVIAHRLSTVKGADRILVMEGGRIVEDGPHDRLISRDGPYSRLYQAQLLPS